MINLNNIKVMRKVKIDILTNCRVFSGGSDMHPMQRPQRPQRPIETFSGRTTRNK